MCRREEAHRLEVRNAFGTVGRRIEGPRESPDGVIFRGASGGKAENRDGGIRAHQRERCRIFRLAS